jgi:glycosyltransferase involved in cell wall biosynthesis
VSEAPELSVVLPCRDQGDHIGRVLESYAAPLEAAGIDYELVAVPNACSDDTAQIVRELGERDARLRCVELDQSGWGRAVLAGMQAARGRVLCYTNSARTDPAEIPQLYERYRGAAPCLAKVRRSNRQAPLREVGSWVYNFEAKLLFRVASADVNGTPKILARETWKALHPSRVDDLVDLELLAAAARARVPVVEMTTEGFSRHGGKSSTNLGSAWRMYAGAVAMWFQGLGGGSGRSEAGS